MTEKRINLIKKSLEFLNPVKIDIKDQGHLHVGHEGAKSGGPSPVLQRAGLDTRTLLLGRATKLPVHFPASNRYNT